MARRIIIGIDGSKASAHAAVTAAKLGLLEGAEVELVGALDLNKITMFGLSLLNEEERETLRRAVLKEHLEPVRDILAPLGIAVKELTVVEQIPQEAIAGIAEAHDAELVLVGRHGHGAVKRLLMGSVSAKLLEICETPALVVPETATVRSPTQIFVPLDFSDESFHALSLAETLAHRHGASLVVFHCTPVGEFIPLGIPEGGLSSQLGLIEAHQKFLEQAREKLDGIVDRLQGAKLSARAVLHTDTVIDGVVRAAEEAEASFIVMSSHGRSGLSKLWLGSVAASVVRRASMPVLVVRPGPQSEG